MSDSDDTGDPPRSDRRPALDADRESDDRARSKRPRKRSSALRAISNDATSAGESTDTAETRETRETSDSGEDSAADERRRRRKKKRAEREALGASGNANSPAAGDGPEIDPDNGSDKGSDNGSDNGPDGGPPDEEPQLLPLGNSLRPIRGGLAIVVGCAVAFCLMAVNAQHRFGVPVAALAVMLATFGVLDLAGTFDDPDERIAGRATLQTLARPLALFGGGAIALFIVICLAVDGRLSSAPVAVAAVLVPSCFLATVVGAYRIADAFGAWKGDADEAPRPLHRRHGFWLIVFLAVFYLPLLGSHSLSDPWETHYGEVAREMLARNDWISTWWAQEGWFFSKPVLDFWIQALAMASFGVRYRSDAMLSAATEGRIPWPEWAVRMPVFLLVVVAVYLIYKAVARVYGRRAGLLGAVVLSTMPQWFLLSNQTMTDMPYVAPTTAAMALVILALNEDPDREVSVYELSIGPVSLRFSLFHLVVGAIVASAIPQVLYLASRNVLLDNRGFHTHLDSFMAGSPGNCGLPGDEACRQLSPVVHGLHPALQALIWAQAAALVVYLNWGERRRQRLYFLAAWFFLALSIMAKVLAGAVFVVAAMGLYSVYILTKGRWRELLRLELASGALVLLAVAVPWYVAMYVRHGQPFTDRIIFHDMFKRAFTHVHDTNEGDDTTFRFYVWQLGYAMFPWTGLVPASLLFWLRRREEGVKSDVAVLMVFWFVGTFAVVSYMLTKFHHYILPALPPAAMLTGILLDRMLTNAGVGEAGAEEPSRSRWQQAVAYGAAMLAGAGGVVWGASKVIGFLRVPAVESPAMLSAGIVAILAGVAVAAASAKLIPAHDRKPFATEGAASGDASSGSNEAFRRRFESLQYGAVGIAAAILVIAVGRDLSANMDGMPNQIRLMHLITYNYKRPWPPSLDFTPTLWAFTIVAATLFFALVVAKLRQHVVAALVALGVVFGVWGLDVYFMKISPHWGQRETTLRYYQEVRELPGPLIAYQMNWKGENFYTGNHVPAFVSSGKRFQDYVLEEKKKGVKVFYFVTEHTRTSTLSNELSLPHELEKLTTPELDNKFLLVRARFD